MAKIFISYPEHLKNFANIISDTLRKNSGHRPALYQEQSDFTLELSQDWAAGNANPSLLIFSEDTHIQNIGKSIADCFKEEGIESNYPKRKNEIKNFPTLTFLAGRTNSEFDEIKWGTLVAKGIIKYFNPEYVQQSKNEKEPLVKRSQDKSYYDRSFNNNATSNASLIFNRRKK